MACLGCAVVYNNIENVCCVVGVCVYNGSYWLMKEGRGKREEGRSKKQEERRKNSNTGDATIEYSNRSF